MTRSRLQNQRSRAFDLITVTEPASLSMWSNGQSECRKMEGDSVPPGDEHLSINPASLRSRGQARGGWMVSDGSEYAGEMEFRIGPHPYTLILAPEPVK